MVFELLKRRGGGGDAFSLIKSGDLFPLLFSLYPCKSSSSKKAPQKLFQKLAWTISPAAFQYSWVKLKGRFFSAKISWMWSDMDKSLSPLEMDVTYLRFGLLWTHKRNICLIGIVGWVSFKWASTTRAERLLKILHWQADFSFWPIYVNFYLGRCNVFQLLHRADVASEMILDLCRFFIALRRGTRASN